MKDIASPTSALWSPGADLLSPENCSYLQTMAADRGLDADTHFVSAQQGSADLATTAQHTQHWSSPSRRGAAVSVCVCVYASTQNSWHEQHPNICSIHGMPMIWASLASC